MVVVMLGGGQNDEKQKPRLKLHQTARKLKHQIRKVKRSFCLLIFRFKPKLWSNFFSLQFPMKRPSTAAEFIPKEICIDLKVCFRCARGEKY